MIIILAALFALQLPKVQNAVLRRILTSVNEIMTGNISFREFRLQPFNTIVVTDFLVTDPDPATLSESGPQDTVLAAKTLILHFSPRGLLGDVPIINRGIIQEGRLNMVIEEGGINLKRVFPIINPDDTPVLNLRKVETAGFNLKIFSTKGSDTIDSKIDLCVKNLLVKRNGVKFSLKTLRAVEKRNIIIESLAKAVSADAHGVKLKDFHLSDGKTGLYIPDFEMAAGDIPVFCGKITDTHLSSKSLSAFLPEAADADIELDLKNLDLEGPLDSITIKNLSFTEARGISGELECLANGLPDLQRSSVNLGVTRLIFSVNGNKLTFSGRLHGPLNGLQATGNINSGTGKASANLRIANLLSDSPSTISGKITTSDLNIGALTGNNFLAECSLEANLSASLMQKDRTVTLESLKIDRLNLFDYDYSGIIGAGTYSNESFDGRIICSDPNLNFIFQGICNLSRTNKNALYKFYFILAYADLHRLKLDKSRAVSKASFELNADYMKVDGKDLAGTIDILSLKLEDVFGKKDIGDIHINSHSNDNVNRVNFNASFADASFVGSRPLTYLLNDIRELSLKESLPALYSQKGDGGKNNRYEIDINLHDTRDLLSFISPGAYIADSTELRLRVSRDGIMNGKFTSPRIAKKNNYLKDVCLLLDNGGGSLNGKLTSKENKFGQLIMHDNILVAFAQDNTMALNFEFNDRNPASERSEILMTGEVVRNQSGEISATAENIESHLFFDGKPWTINPSKMFIDREGIKLDSLRIAGVDQSIFVDGGISKSHGDSVELQVDNFDLATLVSFFGKDLDISGVADGSLTLISQAPSKFGLAANIMASDIGFAGKEIGNLVIKGDWDAENEKMDYVCSNFLDHKKKLSLAGWVRPAGNSLEANAVMEDFSFGFCGPFVKNVFRDFDGRLSGEINVEGSFDQLDISSRNLNIDEGRVTVDFTAVPYIVSGPVHLDKKGFYFDNTRMTDTHNGTGTISGGIDFNNFNPIQFNTHIDFVNTELLGTDINSPCLFYGNVFGSGHLDITGYPGDVNLDGETDTGSNGNFHLSMGYAVEDGSTDILTFKKAESTEWVDPYLLMIEKFNEQKTAADNIHANLRIRTNPGLTCYLDFDRTGETSLVGRGIGNIGVDYQSREKAASLSGDYVLQDGNYRLSILGITRKDFKIRDGSTIRFNGEIPDTDLDINASYTTRTSLSNLTADTTAVSVRRAVECGLRIYDKLRNPQLEFSIDVPDLEPSVKSKVESALNTDDKIQRQFLSLLVTNSFLPDEQSGVVNNSNLLYSNVSELMSNQLNNILQKLNIPLDMGLSYQANEGGTNIFDVAISTQLFNNRVVVNGAIGNRQASKSSNSNVVGDLDIEVKMDKAGALRMSFFSHSADDYTNYLDNLQRNGIGIAYQKEFSSFREFFRELFRKKDKKEKE